MSQSGALPAVLGARPGTTARGSGVTDVLPFTATQGGARRTSLSRVWRSARWAVAPFAVWMVLTVGASSAKAAEETHVFNATLSLTGNCATNAIDPVADPGCPEGPNPPAGRFVAPEVAIDDYGDIYVASNDPPTGGGSNGEGSKGRVDVFTASGVFVTEISVPRVKEIAIDNDGNLYTYAEATEEGNLTELKRYEPSEYNPASGSIAYGNAPTLVLSGDGHELSRNAIAVDRANDHLFVDFQSHISEYGSAAEGNLLLDNSIASSLFGSVWLAVDAAHNRIYASSQDEKADTIVRAYELSAPHNPVLTVNGSTTPAGKFFSTVGNASVATEESTGDFFVGDLEGKQTVYEFTASGEYVSSIKPHGFEYVFPSSIASDDGANSPNAGTLYVPSGEGPGNLYAFSPKLVGAPKIESVAVKNVAYSEAEVSASVTPDSPAPEYVVEYVSQQQFEAGGFAGATVAARGQLPAGKEAVELSAALSGLAAGTSYRVRLTVENEEGSDSKEVTFDTYEEPGASSCPNEAARVGPSAGLPDCRAYELVTPPDTGGKSPVGVGDQYAGATIGTQTVTADGSNVAFIVIGGVLPGFEGGGNFNGDGYLSVRDSSGWTTQSIALNGTQASVPQAGVLSPDHLFEATVAAPPGPFALEGRETVYLRYPDGTFEPVGRGSLGVEPSVQVLDLSAQGAHVIFSTREGLKRQLEPGAPPAGTTAIYDRPVSEEVTHVVSLLPGDVTPPASEDAFYAGASADGSAVAFYLEHNSVRSDIYVRVNNEVTLDAAPSTSTFEGLSADGRYLYYVNKGNLSRFDTTTEETLPIDTSHDATVVNVAPDGSAVFFLSATVLTPGEANPAGVEATPGAHNLYMWKDGATRYVAGVTADDVKGEEVDPGDSVNGLGLWAEEQDDGRFTKDPSRVTADGETFLFESRADVTGFDSGGHSEIYRYEDGSSLICVSCAPSNEVPTGDAHLQTLGDEPGGNPIGEEAEVQNMAPDGNRVFFQSNAPLVPSDTNGQTDVYEWESSGTGSCARSGGCIALISSGQSAARSYVFGASSSGDDVFILTSDLLTNADTDPTLSIYDARVDGGTAPPSSTSCLGEGCRGEPTPPPALVAPASTTTGPSGNVEPAPSKPKPALKCRKGTRKVKQHGKVKCVKVKQRPKPKGGTTKSKRQAGRKGGAK
jgi:hypothetical protein